MRIRAALHLLLAVRFRASCRQRHQSCIQCRRKHERYDRTKAEAVQPSFVPELQLAFPHTAVAALPKHAPLSKKHDRGSFVSWGSASTLCRLSWQHLVAEKKSRHCNQYFLGHLKRYVAAEITPIRCRYLVSLVVLASICCHCDIIWLLAHTCSSGCFASCIYPSSVAHSNN